MKRSLSLVGQSIGPYKIVALVGQGAMAAVYRAEHTGLGREVALKVPHLATRVEHEDLARFRREGRLLASVKHPGVIEILDADEVDGVPFLAMTFVEAPTLEAVLAACPGGKLPEERVRRIASSLLEALGAIHERDIVHRDLKPSNVFVELEDRVILADFGVARPLGEHTMITADGAAVGTFLYMAPEQHSEEPVDPRTDLYMVGLLMYRALCGKLPFTGNMVEIMAAKCEVEALPSPRELVPEVSRGMETVLRRACARRPGERFATAADFRAALGALVAKPTDTAPNARPERLVAARRAGTATRDLVRQSRKIVPPPPAPRALRWGVVAAVAGAFAGGALVAVLVFRSPAARPPVVASPAWVTLAEPTPEPPAPPRAPELKMHGKNKPLSVAEAQEQMSALWPGYAPTALDGDLARFPLKPGADAARREASGRELLARLGGSLPEPTVRSMAERGVLMPDFFPYMVPNSAPLKMDPKRMIVGSSSMIDAPIYDAVGKSTPQTALAMFLVGVSRSVDMAVALRMREHAPRGVTMLDLLALVGYVALTQPGFHDGVGEQLYQLFVPPPGEDRLTLDSWNLDEVADHLKKMDAICAAYFRAHPTRK